LPGACEMLESASKAAAEQREFEIAAHFANCLGSLRAASRDDDGALAAYLTAESLDPANGVLKKTTASFLLDFLNQPAEALRKINAAISLLQTDPQRRYALPEAEGIKSVAELREGHPEKAIAAFRARPSPILPGVKAV